MKTRYFTIGLIATFGAGAATAGEFQYMVNGVAAHNIMAMQHNISNRAVVLPPRTKVMRTKNDVANTDADEYGEMIYYGEYGDDTGILPLIGRSGGDFATAYVSADWQHFDETVKFKSYSHMDTRMDLGMVEFGNNHETLNGNPLDMKFFGGYVGGTIKNDDISMGQDGGFIGAAAHQQIENLDISVIANLGLMVNNVRRPTTTDDFNNIWAAATLDAAYNIALDKNVVLRPNFRAGYMWIYSPNYVLNDGRDVNNKNLGVLELTPGVDLNTNIGDGWSIGARGAYIINFVNGGETYLEYSKLPKLRSKDYFEYGINIEKSVDNLNFGLNVGRHDGGRSGWFGGAKIRYLF